MNLLDKLERKFGRYAIHNLMYYIIILYALGYVIQTFLLCLFVARSRSNSTRTDLENCDLYHLSTRYKSDFFSVQYVSVLYDWKSFGEPVGGLSV